VRIGVSLDQDAAFPMHLRIPAWALGASAAVGGEIVPAQPGSILTINREWHDGDELLLTLPMPVRRVSAYHEAACIVRGPVVYACVPAFDKDENGTCRAREGFGVALKKDAPIEVLDGGTRLAARGVTLPRWGMKGASCDQPPITNGEGGEEIAVTLVPYASAAIRLAVLPQV